MKTNLITTLKFTHNIKDLKSLDFVNQQPISFWIVFKFKANVTYYLYTSKIKFSPNYVSFIVDTRTYFPKRFKNLNGSVGLVNQKSIKIEEDSALDEIQVFKQLPSSILKQLFKAVRFENREIRKELNKWNKCLNYNDKVIEALINIHI